ncbi:hypothetical protein NE237_029060 [Protea cynaroides]|uniref:Uncharacterized protein n=1 Tax=Protea cynaroides TaxID=273540 RepID=A0A9Q0GR50_9MAGN|nr:hypothetical protein NE237_029060 [Protea cynaroides]
MYLSVLGYGLLLFSSWYVVRSIVAWYYSTISSSSSPSSAASGWPALYASLLCGAVFGLLSMVTALTVVVPTTLVTWITVLVLHVFCRKPRKSMVREGKKITGDIMGFAIKNVLRESNIVAAVCAVLGYFALVSWGPARNLCIVAVAVTSILSSTAREEVAVSNRRCPEMQLDGDGGGGQPESDVA